jgi:hypothetical protein
MSTPLMLNEISEIEFRWPRKDWIEPHIFNNEWWYMLQVKGSRQSTDESLGVQGSRSRDEGGAAIMTV